MPGKKISYQRYDGTLPFAPFSFKETAKITPKLNALAAAEKLDFSVESGASEGNLEYSTKGNSKDLLISAGTCNTNKDKIYAVKNLTMKITGSAIDEAEKLLKETFDPKYIQRKKSPLASISPSLFGDYLEIRSVGVLRSLAMHGLGALEPHKKDLTPKEYTLPR